MPPTGQPTGAGSTAGGQPAAEQMDAARKAQFLARRDEEMQRSMKARLVRTEREKKIKERIRSDKAAQEEGAHEALEAAVEKKIEKKEAAKDYRKNYRQREKEVAEDKKRRAAYAAELERQQREREEARKKHSAYMQSLSEQAAFKQAIEKKKYRRDEERERRTIAAKRKFRAECEDIERDFAHTVDKGVTSCQALKLVVDNDLRQKLYQLEGWHRMKVGVLDSELRSKIATSAIGVNASVAQDRRVALNNQYRNRYKLIEKEFADRKAEMEMQVHIQKKAAENDLTALKLKAEEDRRTKKHKAENEYGRTLEDIARDLH